MQDQIAKAKRLLELCRQYNLSGVYFLNRLTLEQLAAAYNGIGPEFFTAKLREAIDKLHPDLECCAFVHDNRWEYSDGSYCAFKASNIELAENGEAIAYQKYAWYDPRRYIRARQARLFADLCQTFGWAAYRAAYENHKKKGNK